jgi:hypothetical protein
VERVFDKGKDLAAELWLGECTSTNSANALT